MPDRGNSKWLDRASEGLSRITRLGVCRAADPDAPERALHALGLSPPAAPARAAAPAREAPIAKRFLFAGDIGFGESFVHHPRVTQLQSQLEGHGHESCLERLSGLLESADYRVGNLKVPLHWRSDPALRGRKRGLVWSDADRTVAALRHARFDAVGLANNHALDCGAEGLFASTEQLDAAGIAAFGAGSDERIAEKPLIFRFDVNGSPMSVVVFAGFQYSDRYAQRYRWYATAQRSGVARLSPKRIAAMVDRLRDDLPAPIFVVYPHWGESYAPVTPGQEAAADALLDAGADIILGHGTHAIQPAEIRRNRPVVYGMGNFAWNAPGQFRKRGAPPYGLVGMLDIASAEDVALRLYPIVTDNHRTRFRNRPVRAPEIEDVADLLATRFGARPSYAGEPGAFHFSLRKDSGTWHVASGEPRDRTHAKGPVSFAKQERSHSHTAGRPAVPQRTG
jgi:cyanophycin synthetase